jgi:Coenzyme F390 synthetase
MAELKRAPLEDYAAQKIGAGAGGLSREQIGRYQLEKLRDTIRAAYRFSPFYRQRFKGVSETELAGLADLSRFPFTTAADIRQGGLRFLSVSQSDISRVVTLDTSGTTGAAKRLYFTAGDQETTIHFFQYGMAALTAPGDRVLILLPGERPGSVGDLLAAALKRLGATPLPHGIVRSLPETLAVMAGEKIDSLVGVPSQVLALARWADSAGLAAPPQNVLLSTDHVPRAVVRELKRVWGSDVFEHYGMTEMGLGGGTDCAAHAGYHLHEADFYFEIIDPASGEAVPDGREGEVVVTTLTRRGMPLIRYRTGDIAGFLPGQCRCGSILKRLARISARSGDGIALAGGGRLAMADLDEAVYAVGGVLDFTASVDNARRASSLTVSASTVGRPDGEVMQEITGALEKVTAIRLARQAGSLKVSVHAERCRGSLALPAAKRAIAELN